MARKINTQRQANVLASNVLKGVLRQRCDLCPVGSVRTGKWETVISSPRERRWAPVTHGSGSGSHRRQRPDENLIYMLMKDSVFKSANKPAHDLTQRSQRYSYLSIYLSIYLSLSLALSFSLSLSLYLSVYLCLSVCLWLTVFLNCFGTFFETVLTFSKLWVQMSQLFAGTSELYCMSAKCSYSPKTFNSCFKT